MGADFHKTRNFILSILWPRGHEIRNTHLSYYNKFTVNNDVNDRILLDALISSQSPDIAYDECWVQKIKDFLLQKGQAKLIISKKDFDNINNILFLINTIEIEKFGMQFNPRISGILRRNHRIDITIEWAEFYQ